MVLYYFYHSMVNKDSQIYLQEFVLDDFSEFCVTYFWQNNKICSTETFVQQLSVLILYFQDRDYYCYWET